MAVLIVYLAIAALVGWAASQRGRSAFGWFLISVLFSPILGIILLMICPAIPEPVSAASVPEPTQQRKSRTAHNTYALVSFAVGLFFFVLTFTAIDSNPSASMGFMVVSIILFCIAVVLAFAARDSKSSLA